MNKLILMGRLTKDPEIRYTQESKAIAKFSLAVDRRVKREGQPDADFFQITAFGKLGEFTEKYLKKGVKVLTESTIQNDNYTDESGTTHYGFSIIAESIEFCESKKEQKEDFVPADENIPFARP